MSKLDDEINALERIRKNILDEDEIIGFNGNGLLVNLERYQGWEFPPTITLQPGTYGIQGTTVTNMVVDETIPDDYQDTIQLRPNVIYHGHPGERLTYNTPIMIPAGYDLQRNENRDAFNLIPTQLNRPKENLWKKLLKKFRG